jgi:ubiquinone/menaquinone biosynthesis C-methylase UbiE
MAVGIDYDRAAESWDAAAGTVYEPLGRLLLDSSPSDLAGRLVLDAGCGTGAVAQAALERGARVVALDRSMAMLRGARGAPLTAVAGDVLDLPFGNHAFDGVTAGFVINQVLPADGLAELARITRPGGAVLASTWASRPPDPVKRVMEELLLASGWTRPPWYVSMKSTLEPISGDPDRLAEAAREAGLTEVRATVVQADLRIGDPAAVVAYRLALPHIAEWFSGLHDARRQALIDHGVRAVRPLLKAWRPAVVLLTGRA